MGAKSVSVFSLLFLFACGGGGSSKEADAGNGDIDAGSDIDAGETCEGEICFEVCVDTTTSVQHCGGCNMACESPGRLCEASECICPVDFVPATVTATGELALIDNNAFAPATLAVGAIFGDGGFVHAAGVGFLAEPVLDDQGNEVPATPLDTPITLDGSLTAAALVAGYQVDIAADPPEFRTGYIATAGTITFDTRCPTGASGTAAGVTFSEFAGTDISPVDGGCSFTVANLAFAIGSCPTP